MGKQILLLGLGQMGCAVADLFARKMGKEGQAVHALAIDTDERTLEEISDAAIIPMVEASNLGRVLDTLDPEILKEWFPCDRNSDGVEYFEGLAMNEGSNQWRMKALLSFTSFLSKEKNAEMLHSNLDALVAKESDGEESDENVEVEPTHVEIYTVASLAGGTGSGLFMPVVMYVKKYLEEKGAVVDTSTAILTLPEVCEDLMTPEQRVKAKANAYASLRELQAINLSGDKASDEPIRIGSNDDPYLGLLFDSSVPEYNKNEKKPFGRVYLVRRMPGVRQLALYTEMLADSVITLCATGELQSTETSNKNNQNLNTTDAIYGGMTLCRTIYAADSIVSYIAIRNAFEKESGELSYLHEKVLKELARKRQNCFDEGKEFDRKADAYVDAILTAASTVVEDGESDSALLGRVFENAEDDTAPIDRLPKKLVGELLDEIDREFYSESAMNIQAVLEESEELEQLADEKKRRLVKANAEERVRLEETAINCAEWLQDVYAVGFKRVIEGEAKFRDRIRAKLDADGSEECGISLVDKLLKDDGAFINPVFALVRLCTLYREIDGEIAPLRLINQSDPITENEFPQWIMKANQNVALDCKYASKKYGSGRFLALTGGQGGMVKGSINDRRMFIYDLGSSYEHLRDIFRLLRGEAFLDVLGDVIMAYHRVFASLSVGFGELESDVTAALRRCIGDRGLTYYVGTSEEEKLAFFDKFAEFIKDSDKKVDYIRQQDALLGELTLRNLGSDGVAGCLTSALADRIAFECHDSGFYAKELDRNVLEVILTQKDSSCALNKAFLAKTPALLYQVPDAYDSYKAIRAIKHRTVALVSEEIREYIEQNSELFRGRVGEAAIVSLLALAGESDGQAAFSSTVSKDTIYVFRDITQLKLCYLEAFCECSADPSYYRAYKKTLVIKEEQSTDMWDPHLQRGFSKEGMLPHIDPSAV